MNILFAIKFTVFIIITLNNAISECYYIENFDERETLDDWKELSDSRMNGMSKATLVLHQTPHSKRAVMFTLLNPLQCGAALAGFYRNATLDVTPYSRISLQCRGQGQHDRYKFVLRHKGQFGERENHPAYVHHFKAPIKFDTVTLELSQFHPYHKGKLLSNAEPLDKSSITSFGILAYGGIHALEKQHGVASLEIDWIRLE